MAEAHWVISDNWFLTNTSTGPTLVNMDTLLAAKRLFYVTARYPQLQGARLIPLSLVFLVSALWRAGAMHLPGDRMTYGAEAWFFGGLAAAVAVSYGIRQWYARRLGCVGQHPTRSAAIPILGSAILAAFAVSLQGRLHVHVPLAPVAVGTVLLAIGLSHPKFRGHYVAAAAALLGYSALPLFSANAVALDAAFDAAIGVVLLIAGVGDHLLLTRTLQPPTERFA